jgi:hypothetical protein
MIDNKRQFNRITELRILREGKIRLAVTNFVTGGRGNVIPALIPGRGRRRRPESGGRELRRLDELLTRLWRDRRV